MMIRMPKPHPVEAALAEVRARVRDGRLKSPLAAIIFTPEQLRKIRRDRLTVDLQDRFQFNIGQEKQK